MRRVAVFSGSSRGNQPIYMQWAEKLGYAVAERGLALVYGGSSVGLMGQVARAALSRSAEVIGVIPEAIHRHVAPQPGVRLEVVADMHVRKARMYTLADAFIALPGGIGTWEEILEVFTWLQLGYHQKPVALLNICGFYDPLLAMLDHAVSEGFLKEAHRRQLLVSQSCNEVFSLLEDFRPSEVQKW